MSLLYSIQMQHMPKCFVLSQVKSGCRFPLVSVEVFNQRHVQEYSLPIAKDIQRLGNLCCDLKIRRGLDLSPRGPPEFLMVFLLHDVMELILLCLPVFVLPEDPGTLLIYCIFF